MQHGIYVPLQMLHDGTFCCDMGSNVHCLIHRSRQLSDDLINCAYTVG
jgi:hypothetical protein